MEPTHQYISKDNDAIVIGTYQECEDARTWHQFPGFTIEELPRTIATDDTIYSPL